MNGEIAFLLHLMYQILWTELEASLHGVHISYGIQMHQENKLLKHRRVSQETALKNK